MARFPIQKPDLWRTDSLLRIGSVEDPADRWTLPYGSTGDPEMRFEKETLGTNERALDGGLVFLGIPAIGFKLGVSISGEGWTPVNLFEFEQHETYAIECTEPLAMRGHVDPANFLRSHVPGSIRYVNERDRCIGVDGMAASPLVSWTWWRPIILARPESVSYSGRGNSKGKTWDWTWRED